MRIAFVSDIHGSFIALEAILADIQRQNIDQLICLGDTVSLGPQPREVLEALQKWNAVTILGNHDQAILEPHKAAQFEITEHLIPDLLWGREHLSKQDLEFIASFRPSYSLRFENGNELLAYHGSPKTTTDLVLVSTPQEQLEYLFEGQSADIFIGGHSHIQMHRRVGKKLFLNSGSVGNAFEYAYTPGNPPKLLPWAEYALVEQVDDMLHVDLRRVQFDISRLLKHVRKSGLPGTEWWFKQYENR